MGARRQFRQEFKVEAIKLVTELGVAVAQGAFGDRRTNTADSSHRRHH